MTTDGSPGKGNAGPASVRDAVALLLAICPELEALWIGACGSDDPNKVGIYNVFAQVVLPIVHALLTGQPSSELDSVLPTAEAEREALTDRLYQVLDRWATSEDTTIRGAVVLEMTEAYGGVGGKELVTVDALLAPAGPALKRLIENQGRMPWGPFYDLLRDQ